MRIENIANNAGDKHYELTIIGKTAEELEAFGEFTQFTADFIEEETTMTNPEPRWSITIIGEDITKKDFRAAVTAELKEFRKTQK